MKLNNTNITSYGYTFFVIIEIAVLFSISVCNAQIFEVVGIEPEPMQPDAESHVSLSYSVYNLSCLLYDPRTTYAVTDTSLEINLVALWLILDMNDRWFTLNHVWGQLPAGDYDVIFRKNLLTRRNGEEHLTPMGADSFRLHVDEPPEPRAVR